MQPRPTPTLAARSETLTNNDFLEMETLGPLTKVLPGHTVEQVEYWGLYHNVVLKDWTDEELDRVLLSLVSSVGSAQ
jgi:hypothetical protein